MRSIIQLSHRFRFMVVALAAGLMIFGVTQIRAMPVDVLPEFSPPFVEIQTESLGLSAEEVEQLITVPMEQDLLIGVPWLDTIRSESVPGLSSIVLVFQPGTDLMRARQMVSERMTQAVALPHVSKPPTILQPVSATGRVMIVGLSSKSMSLIQMGVLARWTIAPRLMGVPGVASVAIWGQRDRQLQVLVDPERLRAQNVRLLDVLQTTGNALWVSTLSFVEASTPGTGGFVDTPNQRLGIRHISPIITPDGLSRVPISDRKKDDGTPLQLGDVANVVEDHQPLIGDAVVNDDSGLLLVVEKFPGTNTLDVTHGVESALAELQPGLSGLTVDPTIYRPATFIETALGNLSWVLLVGGALMVLVFGLWFRNWRIALISAIVIPVSVTIATLVLYLRNASMNVIVFAGLLIAVASLVNDAIIDVDNIVRLLRRHRQEGSTKSTTSIVVEGSLEVRRGIIFATLISALMVLPIFFIEGVTGAFFQPLVLSYGLAVLASMAVATTLTTALSLILLTNVSVDRREFSLVEKIRRGYEAALTSTIYRPRLVLLAIAGSLVIGLAMLPLLGLSLLPDFKERDLLVRLDGAPGTSQTAMTRIAGLVSRELRSTPGIRNVGAHVGRAVLGDQVVSVNSTEFWVSIDPSANYDKTVAAIRKVVGSYPGLNDQVLTYLHDASGDVAEKPSNSIVVRVYGDTDAVLQATATDIQKAITGINGIVDAHIDLPIQQLTLETEVSIDKAQRYGLKPGDVRRAAATMLSGTQVGNLFEEQKIFDVVVWSTPDTRHSLSSIRDLLIDTPAGEQVHLGDVAEVRIVSSPSVIRHEGAKRYFDVVANVRGRDLGAVAADIKTRLRQVQYPLEYHAEVLGDYVTRQASQTRLVELAIAAAIGILFLLQAACGSWRLATLVILSLATALVGGVLAVFVTDGSLSLGSIAGLIAVCGIATRDTVMLINQCQILQRIRGIPFGPKLVVSGTIGRLSPILVSALAIGVAFAPALLLGDVPGLEILRPMAVVVLGGLVTSTLVTLFLVPTLYARFGILETQNLELPPLTVATRGGVLGDLADVPEMSAGS